MKRHAVILYKYNCSDTRFNCSESIYVIHKTFRNASIRAVALSRLLGYRYCKDLSQHIIGTYDNESI